MLRSVALALALQHVGGARVHELGEELEDVAQQEEGNSTGPHFAGVSGPSYQQVVGAHPGGICPKECLTCCKKGVQSSKNWFLCIMKDGLACPPGRKCANRFETGSYKMTRFRTLNGAHQRIIMGSVMRDIMYTEEQRLNRPKQQNCPAADHNGGTWNPAFSVPFGTEPFQKLASPDALDEIAKVQDGGWVVAEKDPNTFQCPEECTECCAAAGSGSFICMLRDGNALPKNRQCGKVSARSKVSKQWGSKTKCKLTDHEKQQQKELPKKQKFKFGKCANRYKCCCPLSDHWTEEVCLPPGTPQAITMKSVERGSQELFLYAPEGTQYQNRATMCRNPMLRSLHYDTPRPLGGCCLKRHRYCCAMCDDGCCRYCWHCDAFEMLYTCSADGGLTNAGMLFRRTAPSLGTCMHNGGQSNQTNFGINRPDSSGKHRVVPLPLADNKQMKPKTQKYRLSGIHNRCPIGTFQYGADKQPCRCKSDKYRCHEQLWDHVGADGDISHFRRLNPKNA